MKSRKKWLPALVMAAALISASLTVPLADSRYACTETELKVPDNFNTAIMVQKNGDLDSFWIERGDGPEDAKPYLYRSQDGGKTWAAQDTGWLGQCADQYAKDKSKFNASVNFIDTDGDGNFYFLAPLGGDEGPMGLFRVSGGKPAILRTVKRGDPEKYYHLADCGEDGVLLSYWMRRYNNGGYSGEKEYGYELVGRTTGAVKAQETLNFNLGMRPEVYAAGKLFGANARIVYGGDDEAEQVMGREPDKSLWLTYDIAAKKEVRKVVNPYDKLLDRDYTDVTWDASTTGPDGSLYHTTRQGVFALKPDASSFTQIMDASAARFQTEMRQIVGISAGYKGDLYAITAYCNEKNPDDPKNGTQLKLLHYTPQ